MSYFGNIPLVTNYLHDIENKTYDLLFNVRHSLKLNPTTPSNITIIGIDATSIDKVGVPWPWPRQFHASLLDALTKAGSKIVFFDIVFDTISPLSLQTQDISGSEVISKSSFNAGTEDDNIFASSIKKAMNVFLACEVEPLSRTTFHTALPIGVFLQGINNDISFLGNTSVKYDNDNFVRRAKVIFPEFHSEPAVSTSLTLRIAQKYLQTRAQVLSDDLIEINKIKIPREILINYYGPACTIKTIPYWKALDLIYSQDFSEFKDKIILIGRSNLKASIDPFKSVRSPDSFATPFAYLTPNFSGVEIQATILSNILQNSYILKVNQILIALTMLLIGILSNLIVSRFRTRLVLCSYLCIFFSIIYLIASFILFLFFRTSIPPTFPIYGIILPIYFVNFLDQYFVVDRERRRQARIFRQLVPSQVADEIDEMDQEQLALGGTKREITVLFTDIKNFTGLCEKYEPEFIVTILNEFFTEMVKIIHKYNGLVDKFIGDAIMSIWGSPKVLETKIQADLASHCALSMKEQLKELNKMWKSKGLKEDLKIRIGINTDEAITGNVGSLQRIQFSAIGDGVNVASRLEAVNKVYGTEILISNKTKRLLDNTFSLREVDTVLVPGKDIPINIYELLLTSDLPNELIETYSKALNSYRNKNLDEAIKSWNECIKINPDDNPSQIMLQRAMKLKQLGISNEWSPIWSIENK